MSLPWLRGRGHGDHGRGVLHGFAAPPASGGARCDRPWAIRRHGGPGSPAGAAHSPHRPHGGPGSRGPAILAADGHVPRSRWTGIEPSSALAARYGKPAMPA